MDVIEKVLKITDQGSASVRKITEEMRGLQRAEREAAEAARELQVAQAEIATAGRRLEELAVAGDKVQTAALNLRRLREEVTQLVASTGNADLGKRILGNAERDFAALVSSSNAAAQSMGRLEGSAGAASAAVGLGRNQVMMLKYALADAANSLTAGASPLTVIMQQGPQAAEALLMVDGGLGAVTSTLSTAAPAFAALGAAVLTAGAALYSLTQIVEDYSAAKNEAVRATAQFAAMMQPLDAAVASARAEQELLTQAQSAGKEAMQEYVEIADLHARVDGQVAEATKAAREEREALTKQLATYTNAASFDAQLTKNRIAQLDEEIAAANRRGDELKGLVTTNHDLRTALDEVDKATKRTTASTKEGSAADKERAAAERYLAEIARERAQMAEEYAQSLREQRQAEQGLRDFALLGADEQTRINSLAEQRVSQALALYEITRNQAALEGALAGIEADRVEALNKVFNAAAQANTRTVTPSGPTAGATLSAVGAGLSDPLAAAAKADPTGITGGVIAIAQAIGNLDDTITNLTGLLTGVADGLRTGGDDLARFVGDVLGNLAPAIVSSVDDFVLGFVQGIPAIVAGLVQAIPSVAIALVQTATPLFATQVALAFVQGLLETDWGAIGREFVDAAASAWSDFAGAFTETIGAVFGDGAETFMKGLLDPATWVSAAQAFGEGIVEWIRQAMRDVAATLGISADMTRERSGKPGFFEKGGAVDDFFSGRSFDTGTTYVGVSGPAMLHAGEEVINPTGMGTERQEMARARATGARFTGSGGALRGVVEFEIDPSGWAGSIAELRRMGWPV